jgi:hypothetical protein
MVTVSDMEEEPASVTDMKRMRLRYAGTCVRCGTPLAAGTTADYDRASKTVACVACPPPRVVSDEAVETAPLGPGRRRAASRGHLTRSTTTAARNQIRSAVRFLTWLDTHNVTVAEATQHHLEDYQQTPASDRSGDGSFIRWLRDSRINTRLRIATLPATQPAVTISDEQRWEHVHRLLHDPSLRSYTRVGGLFTLLFARPLHRIAAMRTDRVNTTDGAVHVTFSSTPIQMPPLLDDLLQDHLTRRGQSLYVSRDTGWLFPGGSPGQHLSTEAFRKDLVRIGIKPYEARKAALFQLAGSAPAPVLAELLGLTDNNAATWARLAARGLDQLHRPPRPVDRRIPRGYSAPSNTCPAPVEMIAHELRIGARTNVPHDFTRGSRRKSLIKQEDTLASLWQ